MIIAPTIAQSEEEQLKALELLGDSEYACYEVISNRDGSHVADCAFPVDCRDCQNWHDGPIIDTQGFPLLRKSNDHLTIVLVPSRPLF